MKITFPNLTAKEIVENRSVVHIVSIYWVHVYKIMLKPLSILLNFLG